MLELERRQWLSFATHGIGCSALAWLLGNRPAYADRVPSESTPPAPHFPAKAKRVIHFVLCGGLSQIDTFDYKPELERFHGKPLGGDERPDVFFGRVGLLRKNDWAFRQRGESGLWISDLFPQLAEVADELTVIRSMYADTSIHTPATFQENTGFRKARFLNPVNEFALAIGLPEDEFHFGGFGFFLERCLDVFEGRRAIGRGFPRAEQVQIRTIQDVNGFHRGASSGGFRTKRGQAPLHMTLLAVSGGL